MFGRTRRRTERQQLLDELAESYGHLKLAATHAAGGTAEMLTPGYDRARNVAARGWYTTRSAFSPLYRQMREGAANARREYTVPKKNRLPMVVGFLAAGAAVGAAGAIVIRRRRAAAEWEEYEPMPSVTEVPYGAGQEPRASSAAEKVTAGAASVAESISSQAGKVADSLKAGKEAAKQSEKTSKATGTTPPASDTIGTTDTASRRASEVGP